jgi:HTH-like domain
MIEPAHPRLSVVRQCALVSISRFGFYYRPAGETVLNLTLMRLIDEQVLETPWYGSRQMARHFRREGYTVGRKRVRRLMAKMGLAPIYQRPRTTIPHPGHRIYPYLLREMVIDRPDQVWCADITYLPMRRERGAGIRGTRTDPNPSALVKRCGHSSGVPTLTSGSGHGPPPRLQSRDGHLCASAGRHR